MHEIIGFCTRNWWWMAIASIILFAIRKYLASCWTSTETADGATEPDTVSLGKSTIYPRCPHCQKELREAMVIWGDPDSDYVMQMVICPYCRKVLFGSVEY